MDITKLIIRGQSKTLAIRHLGLRGCPIVDLRDIPEFQAKNIDVAVFTPQHKWRNLWIKEDPGMHPAGNIMVELSTERLGNIFEGWYYKCKADILCYVDESTGDLYFLPWQKVHNYVETLIEYDKTLICKISNPYDVNCLEDVIPLNIKNHLLPNKLIIKISHSETIKRAAACRAAGIYYEPNSSSSTLIIPA